MCLFECNRVEKRTKFRKLEPPGTLILPQCLSPMVFCGKGRRPEYSAKRGEAAYRQNRSRCHRSHSVPRSSDFMRWMAEKVREFHWSFDVCVGYARRRKLFPEEQIPCTKTLYNLLWKGELPVSLFELPEVLNRRKRKKPCIHKRICGKSIDERPAKVAARDTFGHWESDTVVGRKRAGEAAVFTIAERLTGYYISIRIDGKNTAGVTNLLYHYTG